MNMLKQSSTDIMNLIDNFLFFRFDVGKNCISFISDKVEGMLGVKPEDVVGQVDFLEEIIAPSYKLWFREKIEELSHGCVLPVFEYEVLDRDSNVRLVRQNNQPEFDDEGNLVSVLSYLVDVSDKRVALRDSGGRVINPSSHIRLDGLSNILEGLVHDISNSLTAIAYSDLNRMCVSRCSATSDEKKKILDNCSRCAGGQKQIANVIDKLRTFLNLDVSNSYEVFDLDSFVGDIFYINTLSNKDLNFTYVPLGDECGIRGNKGGLVRAISNVIRNSIEAAIPGDDIGITNSLEEVLGKLYAKITVKNSFGDIPSVVVDRIFEPYFSTKPRSSEKGMGLGLSMVNAVIVNCGGKVNAELDSDGVKFNIYLPVCSHNNLRFDDGGLCVSKKKVYSPADHKVLVLEDESYCARSLYKILSDIGFVNVDLVDNSDDAVLLANSSGLSKYSLAILNYGLPFEGLDICDVLEDVKISNISSKVVLSTGLLKSDIVNSPARYGFTGVIAKPYGYDEVSRVLKKVIMS